MSTPNPALVAASPTLKLALGYVSDFLTTVLTGDALQIGLRVGPAAQILLGRIQLMLPELAQAEESVVLQQATSAINGIIAKLP